MSYEDAWVLCHKVTTFALQEVRHLQTMYNVLLSNLQNDNKRGTHRSIIECQHFAYLSNTQLRSKLHRTTRIKRSWGPCWMTCTSWLSTVVHNNNEAHLMYLPVHWCDRAKNDLATLVFISAISLKQLVLNSLNIDVSKELLRLVSKLSLILEVTGYWCLPL